MSKRLVKEIMTTEVKTLTSDATLLDAHNLVRETGIRHIPVLDSESNLYIGVVSQKNLIAKVFSLVATYGENRLENREKRVPIAEIIDSDNLTVQADTLLITAAEHFLTRKFGCLPVVDQTGNLEGIISSSDFVSLSLDLLQQSENY